MVGVKGDHQRALIDESGRVEPGEGWGSIEPFLYLNDELVTWNDVEAVQAARGRLSADPERDLDPAPAPGSQVTAFAAGEPGRSSLWLRYRVSNTSAEPLQGRLFLALRPFRVNPPWQIARRAAAARSASRSWATPAARSRSTGDKTVIPLSRARAFRRRPLRGRQHHRISARAASCPSRPRCSTSSATPPARSSSISISPPAQQKDVYLVVPLHEGAAPLPAEAIDEDAARLWTEAFDATVEDWRQTLDRVAIELPGEAQKIVDTLKIDARLHPDQRRRRRAAAGSARLQAHLDPRRRADLGRAAAHGPPRRGARLHRMVRALPVRGRRDSLLRRRARRRSRGRARQPRAVGLPARANTTASRATSAC